MTQEGHKGDMLSISHITTGSVLIDLLPVGRLSFAKPSQQACSFPAVLDWCSQHLDLLQMMLQQCKLKTDRMLNNGLLPTTAVDSFINYKVISGCNFLTPVEAV